MSMGDFQFDNGAMLVTNPTDWTYCIGGVSTDNPTSLPPTLSDVSGWVAAADAAGTCAHPSAAATTYDGNGPWGTIPGIDQSAEPIWTTDFTANCKNYVVFRAPLPTGLTNGVPLSVTGLANRTVYLDQNGAGTYESGEPSAVTDASGNYTITGGNTAAGGGLREVVPAGWTQDRPLDPP